MSYPKIHTLWKRNNKGVIIPGEYSCPEFEAIKSWDVSEKIHGMNIRVMQNGTLLQIEGRTEKAEVPQELKDILTSVFEDSHIRGFTKTKRYKLFNLKKVTLFGEGYGYKINGGGKYNTHGGEYGFTLFDVNIDGHWLNRQNVQDIAIQFNISTVPCMGVKKVEDIVSYTKMKPFSMLSNKSLVAEGIVARSHPLMFFNDGTPIMFKLKVKDYIKLDNGRQEEK